MENYHLNKKTRIIITVIAVISVIVLLILFILFLHNLKQKLQDQNTEAVTRYEWAEMLSEWFGREEYESKEPYYADVDENNEYFAYVQSGYEYDILPKEKKFEGTIPVNGEYAAITALKAVGKYKVEMYLETWEEPDDGKYLEVAEETGLIEKSILQKSLTEEECKDILQKAEELYFQDLWKETSKITYQDDVVRLSNDDVVSADEKSVQVKNKDSVKEGDKIVYLIPGEEQLSSGIVTSISNDGILTLGEAEVGDILESAYASEVKTITLDDILEANGYEREAAAVEKERPSIVAAKDARNYAKERKKDQTEEGFTVTISLDSNKEFNVELGSKKTGRTYGIGIEEDEENEDEGGFKQSAKITLDVDDINIHTLAAYDSLIDKLSDPDYLNVTLDSKIHVIGEVSFKGEQKIPIVKAIDIAFGEDDDGRAIFGLTVGIFAKITEEGTVTLEISSPVEGSFEYCKGHLPVIHPIHATGIEAALKLDCKLGLYPFDGEITLDLLRKRIIGIEAKCGAEAEATLTTRDGKRILSCTDISAKAPVMKLEITSDIIPLTEEGDTSIEWNLLEDDEIWVGQIHIEVYADKGKPEIVDQCTWKEPEDEAEETEVAETGTSELNNTYQTRYAEEKQVSAPVFCFDYPDNWQITEEYIQQDVSDLVDERDILTNDRGVTITFMSLNHTLGLTGHELYLTQTESVAPSQFQPIEDWDDDGEKDIELGTMTVQRGQYVGYCGPDDDDFVRYDDGPEFYLVTPESMTKTEQVDGGELAETYGWAYPAGAISIIAQSPDGTFTDQERQEIIEILSSFR